MIRKPKGLSKPSKGAVRNATKVEANGILFDSKLEYYAYKQMALFKINFAIKHKFIIFDEFRYNNKLIRSISWTPDYIIPDKNIILETKGFANDQWSLKIKLIKRFFLTPQSILTNCFGNKKETLSLFTLNQPEIVICKNQKEVDAFISTLIK